jgi:hypothetical protein
MAVGADSPLVAARKFEQLAKGMSGLQRETLRQAGLIVKRSVETQMAAAGASTGKLRGVGKRGGRIGVRSDATSAGSVLVRATGPFHLLESNTKPHRIPSERGGRRRRVVVIPGIGVRSFVQHPGSRGKHPWSKGVVLATPLIDKANKLALQKTIGAIFR